jgi:hypothetical protein
MAAATEQVFAASPTYVAGSQIIQSPFQFIADADTYLRIVSACSVSGVKIAVQGRRLDANGQLQIIEETHTPNNDRTVKQQDFQLGAGALLNLSVFALSGAPLIGQCYVQGQILRNAGGVGIVLGTVLGGYITARQTLGFPGSPVMAASDVTPSPRSFSIGTLSAGTDWLQSVPIGARWQLIALYTQFTADATAGNRTQFLRLSDPSAGFTYLMLFPNVVPPTGSINLSFAINVPSSTVANFIQTAQLPDEFQLTGGQSIAVTTLGLAPGDLWNAVTITVREFLDI